MAAVRVPDAPSLPLTIRRWWPAVLAAAAWIAWLLSRPPRPSAGLVTLTGLGVLGVVSTVAARRAGTPWPAYVGRHREWCALGVVLVYALGVQMADAPGITTDGAIYFSQLRSLVFDRDLDVAREFADLGQPPRPSHFVPIGPTLIWLPLYLAVALVHAVGRAVGLAAPAAGDPVALGLTLPYVRAALLSSFAAGAVGLACVLAILRRWFGPAIALVTTLLVFAATPLVWYMVYEASMTHAASFGAVAALVFASVAWARPQGYTPAEARWLGTLAALAFLMRPQEALFAIVPAMLTAVALPASARLDALRPAVAPGTHRRRAMAGRCRRSTARCCCAPTTSSCSDSRAISTPGDRGGSTRCSRRGTACCHGRRWSTWRSSARWRCSWRMRAWAILSLALLLAMAWVNGSTADWAAGWSFGGRRFTSMLVMLAPGLALVVESALRRPQWLLGLVVAAIVAWNYGLMVQYTAGMVPKDEPVSFGRVVRQQAELATRPPFLYPFSFPANVWFAWREGLPVDRYDLLAVEPITSDVEIVMNPRAERFLLEGWDAPGGDEWGSHWWLNGSPAVMAVPVDIADRRAAEVEITARTRFEEPTVEARLELRMNGRPAGQFAAPADHRRHHPVHRARRRGAVAARLQPGRDRQPRGDAGRLHRHPGRRVRSRGGSTAGRGRWPIYRLRIRSIG